MDVFEKITGLQKGKEGTAPWMVGEQLKDICRRELQDKLRAAESEAKVAQQKLEAMQKEAKLQNPDAAVFKTLFDQVQADFDKLVKQLHKITGEDPAAGERLKGAVNALLDSFRAKVER